MLSKRPHPSNEKDDFPCTKYLKTADKTSDSQNKASNLQVIHVGSGCSKPAATKSVLPDCFEGFDEFLQEFTAKKLQRLDNVRDIDNSFLEELELCSICNQNFAKEDSLLLSCLHGFCARCILGRIEETFVDTNNVLLTVSDKIINLSSTTASGAKQHYMKKYDSALLQCPVCREQSNLALVLENPFSFANKKPASWEKICTTCEDYQAAVMFCHFCDEHLCSQCVIAHQRFKFTKNHELVKLVPQVKPAPPCDTEACFCLVHPDKVNDYFCEECVMTVCVTCKEEKHQNHGCNQLEGTQVERNLNFMKNDLKKKQDEISENLQEIKESIDLFKQNYTEVISQVWKQSELLTKIILEQTQKVVESFDEACSNYRDKLITRREELRRLKTISTNFLTSLANNKNCDSSSAAYMRMFLASSIKIPVKFETFNKKASFEPDQSCPIVLKTGIGEVIWPKTPIHLNTDEKITNSSSPSQTERSSMETSADKSVEQSPEKEQPSPTTSSSENISPKDPSPPPEPVKGIFDQMDEIFTEGINNPKDAKELFNDKTPESLKDFEPPELIELDGLEISMDEEPDKESGEPVVEEIKPALEPTKSDKLTTNQDETSNMDKETSKLDEEINNQCREIISTDTTPSPSTESTIMVNEELSKPDEQPNNQDVGTSRPDDLTRQNEGSSKWSEEINNHDDGICITDIGTGKPDKETSKLDKEFSRPNEKTSGSHTIQKTEIIEPDEVTRKLDGDLNSQDEKNTSVDKVASGQDIETRQPNEETFKPDELASKLDKEICNQDGKTSKPDDKACNSDICTNSLDEGTNRHKANPSGKTTNGIVEATDATDEVNTTPNKDSTETTPKFVSGGFEPLLLNEEMVQAMDMVRVLVKKIKSERVDGPSSFPATSTNADKPRVVKEPKILEIECDMNDDWCAVCNNGGELLCCEKCPKVYHLQCHVPELPRAPKNEWICTLCRETDDNIYNRRRVGLHGRNLALCEKILLRLFCHRNSLNFQHPVRSSVPYYYKIIKQPMDLRKVKKRLSPANVLHYESEREMFRDVQKIFINCYIFNGELSDIGKEALSLQRYFYERVLLYFPESKPFLNKLAREQKQALKEAIRNLPSDVDEPTQNDA